MAHEKAKGQQSEKLFFGSLRASRAIKKDEIFFDLPELGFETQIFSNFPAHASPGK